MTLRGPCTKKHVVCCLVTPEGEHFWGTNEVLAFQVVCPRTDEDDYSKCVHVCHQPGHAEIMALREAGEKARGATAYMKGNTFFCRECQEAMFAAGVVALRLGDPPPLQPAAT